MIRVPAMAIAVGGVLLAASACAQRPQDAAATGHPQADRTRPSVGNACDRKLLTTADVAGILRDPITGVKAIPGAPEACIFTTASFPSITVTLRPGVGRTTVATWKAGRMPLPATPLAGVGDEAVWVSDLNELVAEKSDLLCDIQVSGVARDLAGSTAVEQQKVGALCNKIFAAAP
jgi:hypothetical protein